ncbi:hypothetical protein EDD18DRAFT_1206497 [Armillaria luteobubalina]|uniref:Secreted protein n=1 Tax=Armillaria luteobubalina TaxID=153913 RepID=A0AA39P997_9AGAR|nr:hypothetical protein EDD18DRAFT_1206497 [Armillaria luteobubalina]
MSTTMFLRHSRCYLLGGLASRLLIWSRARCCLCNTCPGMDDTPSRSHATRTPYHLALSMHPTVSLTFRLNRPPCADTNYSCYRHTYRPTQDEAQDNGYGTC